MAAVRAFLEDLSEESRWFRFFSAGIDFQRAAETAVDPRDGLSLVVVTGADARVIGQGSFAPAPGGWAEVAFAVADAWHEYGIATILLAHLADAAADAGIDTFTASVLPSNHRMISVFRDSGYPVELRSGADEIAVTLPTSLTPEGRRRFEERERTAAIAAVGHVLRPGSMAVVGASRRRGTVGWRGAAQPSRGRLRRSRVCGQPERRRGAGPAGVSPRSPTCQGRSSLR